MIFLDQIFSILKRIAPFWESYFQKQYFSIQYLSGNFRSLEEEFDLIEKYVNPGDFCLDIGANVGRYTLKMQEAVGPQGHVFSFEPLIKTFDVLAFLVRKHSHKNVSLFNVACGEKCGLVNMVEQGTSNVKKRFLFDTFTQSHVSLSKLQNSPYSLCISLDSLDFFKKITLVKIDTEGFELNVLRGMKNLLIRDYPTIIIENNRDGSIEYLEELGFVVTRISKLRNVVLQRKSNPSAL